MYVPSSFSIEDRREIDRLIEANSFGTLCSTGPDGVAATQLPFLLDAERRVLRAHMARANRHWTHIASGQKVLVLFGGPHAYISPAWYRERLSVPTWNYETVQVHGRVTILSDPLTARQLLLDLVAHHERGRANPWRPPDDEEYQAYLERRLEAIVAFEVSMDRVEAKAKLSQERPLADRKSVVGQLGVSDEGLDRLVAERMAAHLARDPTGEG